MKSSLTLNDFLFQGYLDREGKVLPAYRKADGALKYALKHKPPEDLSKFPICLDLVGSVSSFTVFIAISSK